MKIISLAPSNTEILFALGLGKEIIATTKYCDFPDDAKYKPKIGGWLDINFEKLQKLKPDVVFTSNFLQSEIVERLHNLKLNIVHVNPINLDEVYESILTIGEATNHSTKAQGIVDAMKRKINLVKEFNQHKSKIKVYCEEWNNPFTVSGNWVPELIEFAGGVSYLKKGKKSIEVEVDQIAKFNPHIVLIAWTNIGRRTNLNNIQLRPIWNTIPAFKKGQIFAIDDSLLNRPGPRLVEGVLKISQIINKYRDEQIT